MGGPCARWPARFGGSPRLTRNPNPPIAQVLSQLEYDWDLFGDVAPGVANGKSEIKFSKLEFYRPKAIAGQYGPLEGATGLVQAVVFDVNDLDRVGFPTPQGRRYCCDRDLIPSIDCVANRVIVKVRGFCGGAGR